MKRILIACALVGAVSCSAFAQQKPATSEKTAVMAPIHQFVDGFNKGDVKSALAACADQTTIIDEFPPHTWNSCGQWATAFDADAKKNGVTDGKVTITAARHLDITGDRAYVVVPASYSYKQNGKPMKEMGSFLAVVLQKGPDGWRMISWAWTKG